MLEKTGQNIYLLLKNAAVGYNGRALIHGIEIGVQRGEIVTLVGPNGSGKSTILKSITRQLDLIEGQVLLSDRKQMLSAESGISQNTADGSVASKRVAIAQPAVGSSGSENAAFARSADGIAASSENAAIARPAVGSSGSENAAFSHPAAGNRTPSALKELAKFSHGELAKQMAVVLTGRLQTELMTCRDVVSMGRYPYTGRLGILSGEDEQKVEEAFAAVHAQHLAERPFDAVSDGERQRILLARAICQEPEIIVLDEPTSYLDIRHKLELLAILHKMAREQGITVVMSLHEIDLAMKISDRIICVRGEKIFACGKPSEILDDETVRKLYDLDPDLGRFDTRTGSLDLFFADSDSDAAKKTDALDISADKRETTTENSCTPDAAEEIPSEAHMPLETSRTPDAAEEIPAAAHIPSEASCTPDAAEEIPAAAQMFSDVKTSVESSFRDDNPEETHSGIKKSEKRELSIPRLMIAAPGSGSGKTLITCGLLQLLQRKKLQPAAFKCGPDYIDPMFHRQVLGIPSRNLDTFFSPEDSPIPEDTVRDIMARAVRKNRADIAVIEGVMGYFDGTESSGMQASSFDLANQTDTPVILIVNAKGMSRSVVPLLDGFAQYEKKQMTKEKLPEDNTRILDTEGRIRGVILNRISAGMFPLMKKWIEEDTNLKVIGYVPQDDSISWGSRHLGLLRPEEITDLQYQIEHLADILEKTIDWDLLLEAAQSARPLKLSKIEADPGKHLFPSREETEDTENQYFASFEKEIKTDVPQTAKTEKMPAPRIAVARDEAFNFYYEDNLELLRECGAQLIFFSPVRDRELPHADGLLLGGGYPELYAKELSENEGMKARIRECAAQGMPVLAECGGFMYLQDTLELSDGKYQMCGVLPGTCRMTDRLVRFGYIEIENNGVGAGASEYLQKGHRIRGHEFHYFDSTENGTACTAYKPGRKRSWDCIVAEGNIMAGFPHLYYRSDPDFAAAFVERCRQFSSGMR